MRIFEAFLYLAVTSPTIAFGQATTASPDVIERVSKALVFVKGASEAGQQLGSGFLLTPDGKIATNLHVIRGMTSGGVQLASGEIYDKFSVLAFDERKDLAIIQIAGFDLPTIELGNSNGVRAGESVFAMGSPLGLKGSVTAGVVSAVRDDFSGGFKVIQTDAAVNPGNSGGPLMTSDGKAIGVITSKLRGTEALNFAVPINYVRGLLASLQKPMDLKALHMALSASGGDVFKDSAAFPSNWKSMMNGSKFSIRRDVDRIYVEWKLSDQERKFGFFYAAELKKQDASPPYKGLHRFVLTCFNASEVITNRCPFDTEIEFFNVTETRIEGRLLLPLSDVKIDCRKCRYDKPFIWGPFTWIPE